MSSEESSTWAIYLLSQLILVTLLASYLLKRIHFDRLHESVIGLILGIIVGLIITSKLKFPFDNRYFFNLLLPPIILHSGYGLMVREFNRNLGKILLFSIFGTVVSCFIIGFGLLFITKTGFLNLSTLECFMFGAILSSTDPIAILSLFKSHKVHPNVHHTLFGESMLNDAVSIVLYSTLSKFQTVSDKDTSVTLLQGSAMFLGVLFGSLGLGLLIGLFTAFILKKTRLSKYPDIEICLVVLMAYTSYLFSNALDLSGIVSLLFCGMTFKHYAHPNLSKTNMFTLPPLFSLLSLLAEISTFIYLGLTLPTLPTSPDFFLIVYLFLIVLIGRAGAVFGLSSFVNWVDLIRHHGWLPTFRLIAQIGTNLFTSTEASITVPIPLRHQILLFWSGLRGAVCFALSMDFEVNDQSENSSVERMRMSTLMVVLISIVGLGGSMPWLISKLKGGFTEQEIEFEKEKEIQKKWSNVLGHASDYTGNDLERILMETEMEHDPHQVNPKIFGDSEDESSEHDPPDEENVQLLDLSIQQPPPTMSPEILSAQSPVRTHLWSDPSFMFRYLNNHFIRPFFIKEKALRQIQRREKEHKNKNLRKRSKSDQPFRPSSSRRSESSLPSTSTGNPQANTSLFASFPDLPVQSEQSAEDANIK